MAIIWWIPDKKYWHSANGSTQLAEKQTKKKLLYIWAVCIDEQKHLQFTVLFLSVSYWSNQHNLHYNSQHKHIQYNIYEKLKFFDLFEDYTKGGKTKKKSLPFAWETCLHEAHEIYFNWKQFPAKHETISIKNYSRRFKEKKIRKSSYLVTLLNHII